MVSRSVLRAIRVAAADRVFHSAFLPTGYAIAEKVWTPRVLLKSVMFANSFPLSKLIVLHIAVEVCQLAADGRAVRTAFSIDWALNHAEAGLSFVENQQPLPHRANSMKSASQ